MAEPSRVVGNVLVMAGAVVGVAAVTAVATGFEIRLSPEMMQLLTYKALGAAAAGLIIAGTWVGRAGSRGHPQNDLGAHERSNAAKSPTARPALSERGTLDLNPDAGRVEIPDADSRLRSGGED